MKMMIVRENLAIPIGNIDYVRLFEEFCRVEINTQTASHDIGFETIDEALEFFDTVCEMIDKL